MVTSEGAPDSEPVNAAGVAIEGELGHTRVRCVWAFCTVPAHGRAPVAWRVWSPLQLTTTIHFPAVPSGKLSL